MQIVNYVKDIYTGYFLSRLMLYSTAASLKLIFIAADVNPALCCLWNYTNLKQEAITPSYFVEKALKILMARIPRATFK